MINAPKVKMATSRDRRLPNNILVNSRKQRVQIALFKSLCHPLHQEFSDHVLFPSNYEDLTRGTVWSVIPQILRRLQVRIAPANGFGNGRSPSSRAKGDHTLRLVAVGHAPYAPAPRAYLLPRQWRSAPDDAMRQHAAAVVSQFEC